MQSVSSKIWTRVAVSISNDDNNYTTGNLRGLDWVNSLENARKSLLWLVIKIYQDHIAFPWDNANRVQEKVGVCGSG